MNLSSSRVKLRQWMVTDVEPFAELNADSKVMEFFPQALNRDESLACLQRLQCGIAENGWGLWAVEISGELAGFTGLSRPKFEAHFTPCTEIGWRFAQKFWGQGYALEAAQLALGFAFENLHLPEILSFTSKENMRSQRLMQRLGMTHSSCDDFEHPLIPPGHKLRPHVLYRMATPKASLNPAFVDMQRGQSEK